MKPSGKNKGGPSQPTATKSNGNSEKSHSKKKKKKRLRGPQKFRIINVVQTGETSQDRYLKGGRIRKLDILKKTNEDGLTRKTRDMLRQMAKVNGQDNTKRLVPDFRKQQQPSAESNVLKDTEIAPTVKGEQSAEANDETSASQKQKIEWLNTATGEKEKGSEKDVGDKKKKSRDRVFKGIQPGESYQQFLARLRIDRQQLSLETARQANHQRSKKKAHYEKRSLRLQRRKRRNRGEVSSDDDEEQNLEEGDAQEDDWNERESELSRLPMYWQEIVHNQGKPISEKKRKRMERMEKLTDEKNKEKVKFGEQVHQPPTFTSLPKNRTRGVRKN